MGVAATDDELTLGNQQSNDDEPPNDEPADPPQDGDPQDPPDGGDDEDDEVVVQIGDEEPPASEEEKAAPEWVRDVRRENREKAKRIKELEAQLAGVKPTSPQVPTLPEKPTLAAFDYDEDKFQAATDGWYATKREVEAHEASQRAAVEAHQKSVQAVHDNYAKSKAALKVQNFQDAEDAVVAALDVKRQDAILLGTENPGLIVFALGTNPKKLAELASIKDPWKFAVALGKLETEVKVTKRTSTKPAPESTVRGGSGAAPATSATLERLEAEAAKTGDRSKVIAYKRQQRSGK